MEPTRRRNRRELFRPHIENQTNELSAIRVTVLVRVQKGGDFYVAIPSPFLLYVALSRGCSQRGLIYSRRFISGVRQRAICFMIQPLTFARFSIHAVPRILFHDFAFCHAKFEYMTETCGEHGQIFKNQPEKFRFEGIAVCELFA